MKAVAPQYLAVTEAKYVSGYRILLTFNDGTVRLLDFGPFLAKARNPDTTDYRDLQKFRTYRIEDGDLVWGDFQMIFPIMDLYRGNFLKSEEAAPTHLVLSETLAGQEAAKAGSPVSYKKSKSASGAAKRRRAMHHA